MGLCVSQIESVVTKKCHEEKSNPDLFFGSCVKSNIGKTIL